MDKNRIIQKTINKLAKNQKVSYKMEDFLDKVKYYMHHILPPVKFYNFRSVSSEKSKNFVSELVDNLNFKEKKDFWLEKEEGFPEKIMILEKKIDNNLQKLIKTYGLKEY